MTHSDRVLVVFVFLLAAAFGASLAGCMTQERRGPTIEPETIETYEWVRASADVTMEELDDGQRTARIALDDEDALDGLLELVGFHGLLVDHREGSFRIEHLDGTVIIHVEEATGWGGR